MAIAKIIYKSSPEATGEVWMDTTQKTVTAGTMLSGTTALKNDGTSVTGNIATKTSSNLTVSGATVTAPAGYYASDASKSVASGTAGTPTATKGTVSNHSISITPSVTNTTGYITGSTISGTAVSVDVSELESGTKSISENGTGISVSGYSAVDVDVEPDIESLTVTPSTSQQVFNGMTPVLTVATGSYYNLSQSQQRLFDVFPSSTNPFTLTSGETYFVSGAFYLDDTSITVELSGSFTLTWTAYSTYYYCILPYTQTSGTGVTYVELYRTNADYYYLCVIKSGANCCVVTTPIVFSQSGGIDGYLPVTVNAIPNEYVIPTGTKTITSSGTTDVTNYASASVAAGSATTPSTTVTATPSISINSSGLITATASATQSVTPTVSAGYVSSGTAGTITVSGSNTSQLSTQAAQTIHPSTTDQTIASGKYLTGTQTIAAVTHNLDASKILSGTTFKIGDASDDDCVASVTGTASARAESQPEKLVNFIDYDGTILHSYDATEFANLSALPSNPTHDGLTAQGWNWTLAEINSQLANVPGGQVWVGQMYGTTDGKTHIFVELLDSFKSPYLNIRVNGLATIEWGDGSSEQVVGSSLDSPLQRRHVYASAGNYAIKIGVNSGSIGFGSSSYTLLNAGYTVLNINRVYANRVTEIRVGNNVELYGYAFAYLQSMEALTLPNTVTQLQGYTLYNNVSLKALVLPNSVDDIQNTTNPLYGGYDSAKKYMSLPGGVTFERILYRGSGCLRGFTIPHGAITISDYAFSEDYSISSLVLPSTVTSIGANAFYRCASLSKIKFLSATPPTVSNSNAFTDIQYNCVISVPTGKLSAYTSATNYPNPSTYTYIEE